MNQQLQDFARQTIIDGLDGLPDENRRIFKLMYGRLGGKRTMDDAIAMSIPDVVKEIPESKLDWAMQQVERTVTSAPW